MPWPEDSGGPSHPRLFLGCFCVAFGDFRDPRHPRLYLSKLYQIFRERDLPYDLKDSLPTLRPSCSHLLQYSAMVPRLDTAGRLALTDLHCCISPDRDFHPERYAGLCPARQNDQKIRESKEVVFHRPLWFRIFRVGVRVIFSRGAFY